MPKRNFVYIAIPLPEVAKQELESFLSKQTSSNKYPVSWTNPANAQIMLVTLGNLAPDRIDDAIKAVEKTASTERQFAVNAEGLGYFAKERTGSDPSFDSRNRWIVYLDIPDKTRVLRGLYKNLFRNLAEEGFFPAVHFNPRITLGSLTKKKASREEREMILENLISDEEIRVNDFLVDKINVYEMSGFEPRLIKSALLKN